MKLLYWFCCMLLSCFGLSGGFELSNFSRIEFVPFPLMTCNAIDSNTSVSLGLLSVVFSFILFPSHLESRKNRQFYTYYLLSATPYCYFPDSETQTHATDCILRLFYIECLLWFWLSHSRTGICHDAGRAPWTRRLNESVHNNRGNLVGLGTGYPRGKVRK